MTKATFKRNKEQCPYNRACMDYRRNKDICHDGEWSYCFTFKKLNKKEKNERAT